jgi:hypothetical protein
MNDVEEMDDVEDGPWTVLSFDQTHGAGACALLSQPIRIMKLQRLARAAVFSVMLFSLTLGCSTAFVLPSPPAANRQANSQSAPSTALSASRSNKPSSRSNDSSEISSSRRSWCVQQAARAVGLGVWALGDSVGGTSSRTARAAEGEDYDPEEFAELYNNPAIPQAPEEKSGLTVLRVAEVAQFQEQILRSIASGELTGVQVAPMQFQFGTQILLRNSNLDGNMKLMIYREIPRRSRKAAIRNAVATMNTLQEIAQYAGSIQRDFETSEMITLADMYRTVRLNLNQLYEYLPDQERNKYYGYFMQVTAYEKKIADGVYNPDIDGVLNFD